MLNAMRLILVTFFGLAIILLGVAYAAGIPTTAGNVGGGTGIVSAPDVNVTAIEFELDPINPLLLNKVRATIEKDVSPGLVTLDVYLVLRDSDDLILGVKSDSASPDGGSATAEFNFNGEGIAVADIDSVDVTICEDGVSGDFKCG